MIEETTKPQRQRKMKTLPFFYAKNGKVWL
jgi:hypothetical protein